jgi:hypothetical protein
MTARVIFSYTAQRSVLAGGLNFVFGRQHYESILIMFGGLNFGYNYEVNFCTLVTAIQKGAGHRFYDMTMLLSCIIQKIINQNTHIFWAIRRQMYAQLPNLYCRWQKTQKFTYLKPTNGIVFTSGVEKNTDEMWT